jgi:protein-disulfide isomerase
MAATRRGAVAALVAVAALGLGVARAAAPPAAAAAASPGEMTLGSPKAPLTVVEYASVGCPHCALWANDVFPSFRAKYIDTGKVRFVFREMLTGNGALAAAGFLTARCAGPTKYFQVVDDVFAQQEDIQRQGIDLLAKIAARAGLTRAQFDACLADGAALKALNDRTQADASAHQVTGTPTFFVGAERLEGDQTLADLDAAIARAETKH